MGTPPNIKTKTIVFTAHTPVNLHHVGREHIGRVQYRPASKGNPQEGASMEPYFPKGTTIEIPDYVESGFATVVPVVNDEPAAAEPAAWNDTAP